FGYTPIQLRHAYGLESETAAGQSVAVIGIALSSLEQDVNTWSQHVGTRQLDAGQLMVVPTPDGAPADTSPRLGRDDLGGGGRARDGAGRGHHRDRLLQLTGQRPNLDLVADDVRPGPHTGH